MSSYLARRLNPHLFRIMCDGYEIGSLSLLADDAYLFAQDDLFVEAVNPRLFGKGDLKEILAIIREVHEALVNDYNLEAQAEIDAENAWLRHAEYDPEAEAFTQWEESMGKY